MITKSKAAGIAFAVAAATTWGLAMVGAFETGAAAAEVAPPAARAAAQASANQPAPDCTKQAWPYVARECLAAADGTPVRQVTRTIAIVAR
jgi:hypothetical protein